MVDHIWQPFCKVALFFYLRTSCFKNLMKIMGNPAVKKAQFNRFKRIETKEEKTIEKLKVDDKGE